VLLPENEIIHSDPHLGRPMGALSELTEAPEKKKKKGWFW
jgi:hypothetical protein